MTCPLTSWGSGHDQTMSDRLEQIAKRFGDLQGVGPGIFDLAHNSTLKSLWRPTTGTGVSRRRQFLVNQAKRPGV